MTIIRCGLPAISMCICSLALAATPVQVKLTMTGPSGPMADFYLRANYRDSAKYIAHISAKTNSAGTATFDMDREIGAEIEISVGDATDGKTIVTSEDEAASQAFRASLPQLGLPPVWIMRLPEGTPVVERSVSIPAARTVQVRIPAALTEPRRWASLDVVGFMGQRPRIDAATRVLSRPGIPINQAFTAYFTFDESVTHGRSIPIQIPASSANIELPEIVIDPVVYSAFVLVEEAADSRLVPISALEGMGNPGVTLVSSDGQMIISAISPQHGPSKVPVPPGTYYYAPSSMGAEDFQVKLIQKLTSGTDLSSLFPHVTVAAGETKTLQVNPVDTINGIYALP